MLFAATVGVLAFALTVNSARRQRTAIAAICEMGGTVRYEYEVDSDGSWLRDAEPPSYGGLTSWLGKDLFCGVRSVDFHKDVSDEEVRHILDIPSVREVNLAYCYDISDDAVAYVAKLPNLRDLDLYRNDPTESNNFTPEGYDLKAQGRITDTSLEYLSKSKTLEELGLWDNNFTDRGLDYLADLKTLREVDARSPRFTQAGIDRLKKALPNAKVSVDITPVQVPTAASP
jgi:hypothetical protein